MKTNSPPLDQGAKRPIPTDAVVPQHLYIHVPFCDGKCSYCGFYSELHTATRAEAYINSVLREMDLLFCALRRLDAETIYIGGGTPTILPDSQFTRLIEAILARVAPRRIREWTVEANPGTISTQKAQIMKDAGVNRVSIGVQSLDDAVLRRIGRRHTARDVAPTVESLRNAGIHNIGLDLIACLPGVDELSWRRTIRETIALSPTHVSVYGLSIEEDSKLARQHVRKPSDSKTLRHIAIAERMLRSAGLMRYEISNYARPGAECLHNLAYWRGKDYIGIGPAASSRIGLHRRTNKSDLDAHIRHLSNHRLPPCTQETVAAQQDIAERLIFRFRLAEGVDLNDYAATAAATRWESTLRRLRESGLTRKSAGRWFLTKQGINLADYVASELLP